MNSKKIAAEKAVGAITDGMIVGLGTGSTAFFAIEKIGEKVKQGMKLQGVPTSLRSERQARELGIPVFYPEEAITVDLTIDGADQVDRRRNLIKGGGGSLLREKVVAFNSRLFFVIVDESKVVETLTFPLAVEIIPFASGLILKHLRALGCTARIRKEEDRDFLTDNGNLIADCRFETPIDDPEEVSERMKRIPGVVETGLFPTSMVSSVFVGYSDGTVKEI